MSSSLASASSRSGAGPRTAVQASFHPGSPADFESPWSENVSASAGRAETDLAGRPRRGNSTNTSSTMSAQSRRAQSASIRAWSASLRTQPVGFAGLTSTTARVVSSASAATSSRSSEPNGSSGSGKERSSTEDSSARNGSSG
jgi:hypothetical protein